MELGYNRFFTWLHRRLIALAMWDAINAFALGILVIVTIYYARLVDRQLKIEEKREKAKREQFYDILLAEFIENEVFMGDLLEKINEKNTGKSINTWFDFKGIFIDLREDGFNAFRNQGGVKYIEDCQYNSSSSLYYGITEYYASQYQLNKKINLKIDESIKKYESLPTGLPKFKKDIAGEINALLVQNKKLQAAISTCKISISKRQWRKNFKPKNHQLTSL